MKKEAEVSAAEDLRKAEVAKIRNEADNAAYQMEQQLKEHGDKIPADERAKLEASINNLREVMKGDDADAIKKATDTLLQDAQAVSKIIYEEAAKQQAAAAPSGTPSEGAADSAAPKDDDVIDAEFEVKDSK